jgi:hypothetical protein
MSLIEDIFSGIEKALLGAVESAFHEALNPKKASSDNIRPGDIDLIDVVLMSEDQQRAYSLISQAVTLDIYESIMSPVMWCEVTIADSMGLLQSFPILGEEYIKIVFQTPGWKGAPAEYLMRVNAVTNKQATQNNKRITYTLQCCSSEMMTNVQRTVTLRETDTTANIIEKILKDELRTNKQIYIERTAGIEEILLTRVSPFSAIDFLRQRSVSPTYEASAFSFYENRKGYWFASIEKLFDYGKKQVESGNHDKIFFYDTSRKDSIEDMTMRNILAYNQMQFGDSLTQVQSGALNNQVQNFDLITGDIQRVTYTDNLGADRLQSTSDTSAGGHTTSFTRSHGKTTPKTRLITTRSDRPETNIVDRLTRTSAFAQKIAQNITQIHIYGDSDIQVGDIIECRFPSGVDTDNDSGLSRLDSGSYLVAKVRHMILSGDRPQYTQALELIKTDLQEVA